MHCFYHQDRDALGTCKSCGKGLCADCAVDLTKGLACRERCEPDVKAIIRLVDHSVQMQPATTGLLQAGGTVRLGASIFYLACGTVFFVFGLASDRQFDLITILGGCFLAYGLFHLLWARQLAARVRKAIPERPPD